MIKDILLNLSVSKPRDVARNYAISMAERFDAHLSAVAFAEEFPTYVGKEGMTTAHIGQWFEERRGAALKAVRAFDECVRPTGLQTDSRTISDMLGPPSRLFSEAARNYDLAVLAQSAPEDRDRNDLLIEETLFGSGRPILIVPYIHSAAMKLDRVLICWNASKNAARAIADAMPILVRASAIQIIAVHENGRGGELDGTKVAEHLARHKLRAKLRPIVSPDIETANIILNEAADNGADLIVMGGYGHTRLREFVLGGVTRSMLQTMTVPVLMSH
jgi:nucleotide-binding universal stress UspA family protein